MDYLSEPMKTIELILCTLTNENERFPNLTPSKIERVLECYFNMLRETIENVPLKAKIPLLNETAAAEIGVQRLVRFQCHISTITPSSFTPSVSMREGEWSKCLLFRDCPVRLNKLLKRDPPLPCKKLFCSENIFTMNSKCHWPTLRETTEQNANILIPNKNTTKHCVVIVYGDLPMSTVGTDVEIYGILVHCAVTEPQCDYLNDERMYSRMHALAITPL